MEIVIHTSEWVAEDVKSEIEAQEKSFIETGTSLHSH